MFTLEMVCLLPLHGGNGSWQEKRTFVKELTKMVWGVAALRGRSVTGPPGRRFLNTKEPGTTPQKRALTPKKLQAVGSKCLACILVFEKCILFSSYDLVAIKVVNTN